MGRWDAQLFAKLGAPTLGTLRCLIAANKNLNLTLTRFAKVFVNGHATEPICGVVDSVDQVFSAVSIHQVIDHVVWIPSFQLVRMDPQINAREEILPTLVRSRGWRAVDQ